MTEGGRAIFTLLLDAALFAVILFLLYMSGLAVAGLFNKPFYRSAQPHHRFCVIVPAHNEEAVIGHLLDNLEKLDYPDHLYDVVVIADNCSDQTARVADREGVRVLQRTNHKQKGKGFALKYAFERLGFIGDEAGNQYDAAAVFDADNLVASNFLRVMNTRLLRGEKLIQCFLDSKNPADTWISSAYSIMFWLNNRFLNLSRYNLGLCSVFMGTGMCISSEVLKDVGWNTKTLVEDLEYSIQALLAGYRTTYAHNTRIYDEKPLTFRASCRQRLRWARGQIDVLFTYAGQMLKCGLSGASPVKTEAGLRLLQILVLVSAPVVMWLHGILGIEGATMQLLMDIPHLGFLVAYFPYMFIGLMFILDGHDPKVLKYALLYPIFTLSWLTLLVAGLFTYKRKEWMPTEHSRGLSFSQVADRDGQLNYPDAHLERKCPDQAGISSLAYMAQWPE